MQRILIKHPWENFFAGNLKKEDASEFFFFFFWIAIVVYGHQAINFEVYVLWLLFLEQNFDMLLLLLLSFFIGIMLCCTSSLTYLYSLVWWSWITLHAPFGSCSVYLPRTQENYLYLRKEWMGLYMPLIWFIILTTLQHRL